MKEGRQTFLVIRVESVVFIWKERKGTERKERRKGTEEMQGEKENEWRVEEWGVVGGWEGRREEGTRERAKD